MRKRSTPKQRASRSKARQPAGRLKRFLRAFAATAITAFSIASCALSPQLRDQIPLEPILSQLGLPSHEQAEPRTAPAGAQVQTQFAQCRQLFPSGRPPIVPAGQALRELCFSAFAVLHSGQTKTPVFVAQRLNRQMLVQGQGIGRTDRFYPEARLPAAERAELADYRGSGYSRGHMAPAGDMHSPEAMAQSFSLANMVPQNQRHNAGAWNRIENDTRKYVMRAKGDVYVFTGPVYEGGPETMGAGRVAVPSHLFKVVSDAATGRSWVHWQANSPDAKAGAPISYEEFVRRTGLRLLP
ncbi:MAG: DNA/RNA non-specific endonuclease [Pusillimonas sp.]